jgi:hypothetical protein
MKGNINFYYFSKKFSPTTSMELNKRSMYMVSEGYPSRDIYMAERYMKLDVSYDP